MKGLIAQLRGFGPLRLAVMAGVGVAVLGLLVFLALRAAEPPMALLYGELEQRDAAAIVAALERQRVPHRIAGGGSQVLVPEADVPRLRLALAREGLPSGGSVGYEIFDRGESLTTTPFQQDINRLRALEGELSRSIRGLAGVRAARVHLVLPRRDPFSRDRGEAQASVVLTMQGAQRLDRDGVQAVLHLVSAAVPGLRPQNVSIVDSRGELLARGGQALAGPAAAQGAEELRRAQELRLARAVEDLLERSLGPGRVRAEATVELDFDRVQTVEERFDPDNQVPRSTQSTNETSRNAEPGNVSVANQLPGAEAAAGGARSEQSRQEETTNFEIGRITRNTTREQPAIRRISVAVLVDGAWEPVPGAAPRWRERTADEMARITSLARSAVGFDERRGDRVEVVSLRFADPPPADATPDGFVILGQTIPPALLGRMVESAVLALVALLAILLLGRPLVSRLAVGLAPQPALAAAGSTTAGTLGFAPEGRDLTSAGVTALPAGAEAPPALAATGAAGTQPGEEMVTVARVEGQLRASALHDIAALIDANPDQSTAVLRRWLTPEEP
ncbi:flagellar basal-body MS-ring/collar protein FliF [Falsiroseomonas oryziterrae]|uniref:flagellar basal-body MS-ring/collar protein FliF n=1 Tax=Falsiroseomonas oryziterrae TaxID=2911368 RepID=UPI001F02243D|nr:flagellar basal-body MS-ring/collar protein FliF [Roseomonas sp. NPKOSM-4]